MKAIIQTGYGGPDRLMLGDLPVPEPGPGDVRLRVLACAVNLSDWEYLTGTPFYARMVGGLFRPRLPVLGSDIVGIVDKPGSGVGGIARGDRVMGDFVMTRGGFAEFACVPAQDTVPVPEALASETAAALPQAGGIAVTGTEGLASGTRFLINGAGGGSGSMALQLAKEAGAHVTAVDNGGKTAWLRSLGADAVIDYRYADFAATGVRWERILDLVATRGPRAIARALSADGTYRAVGGSVPTLLSLLLGGRFLSGRQSIGMLIVPSGRSLTERVARLAVEGRIAPHIEAVVPLRAVPDALARTGRGAVKGRIVVLPAA